MSFKLEYINFLENRLPEFKELKSKGITQYGDKNKFPDDLIYMANKSAIHNAIVLQKILYLNGSGVKGVPQELQEKWNKYDTLQDFKYKCLYDLKMFGGMAVEVIYDRKLKPSFYHIDFSKIRTLDHSQYFYADEWANVKKDDMETYAPYNPTIAEPMSKQLYYYREYRAGLDVYPLPEYYPALNYIDIDARISNFHLNNIASGFAAGTLVQLFKGEPTPEEARLFKRKFAQNAQGDSNGGAVLIQYNDINERPAQIDNLQPSDLDKMFIELVKQVEQAIFVAHNVTSPMLFGVRVEGELGGRNEMATAYDIFYRQYVRPNTLKTDPIFTMFMNAMGVVGKIETMKFAPVEIDYIDLYKENIVDVNEVRQYLGLPQKVNVQLSEENPFGWDDKDLKVFQAFGEEDVYFEFADLTEKELKILSIVKDNEKATIEEISELTEISEKEVAKILEVLDQKGKISYGKKAIRITDDSILKQTLIVRYKYEERPDAPALIGESREFCQRMTKLNRLYSREDIDKMSSILGYDVWKRRGGWYHNPKTDVNEPACRHEWTQKIVRRKKDA
jgi:DNA-binding Lrp family transcriptional regulator